MAAVLYSTLFHQLKGAELVVAATAVAKDVDSLSTLYRFRIDRLLADGPSDTAISVITFVGHHVIRSEEERYEVGGSYLLILSRNPRILQGDAARNAIYRKSNAYYTRTNFPKARKDFADALEAVEILISLEPLKDTLVLKRRFLDLLLSQNHFILESAIEELSTAGAKAAIPDIRRVALRARNIMVRFQALTALYNLHGGGEAPTYFRAMHDPDAFVRQRAIACLIWANVVSSEDSLITLVADTSENIDNRMIAAGGLLKFHSVRSIPTLESIRLDDPRSRYEKQQLDRIIDSLRVIQKSMGK